MILESYATGEGVDRRAIQKRLGERDRGQTGVACECALPDGGNRRGDRYRGQAVVAERILPDGSD